MSEQFSNDRPPLSHGLHPRFGVDTVELEGFTFLNISEAQFVDLLVAERKDGRGGWVITPNCDILRQAHADPKIRSLFLGADAAVADGMPLIWASRVQGTPLHGGRICGSNLIYSIPNACANEGLSIFLLGGAGDTGARTGAALKALYPGLRIVGGYSPPFGFEKTPQEYDTMKTIIEHAKPDVVFVALSVPKTERLIEVIRGAAPDAWWIGVGASFDFVSGAIPRAPGLMQRVGMEWLFRMIQDPKRLVRRYLLEDLPFLGRLMSKALRKRFATPRITPAVSPAPVGKP